MQSHTQDAASELCLRPKILNNMGSLQNVSVLKRLYIATLHRETGTENSPEREKKERQRLCWVDEFRFASGRISLPLLNSTVKRRDHPSLRKTEWYLQTDCDHVTSAASSFGSNFTNALQCVGTRACVCTHTNVNHGKLNWKSVCLKSMTNPAVILYL